MQRQKIVLAWTALVGLMLVVTGWGIRSGLASLFSSVQEVVARVR